MTNATDTKKEETSQVLVEAPDGGRIMSVGTLLKKEYKTLSEASEKLKAMIGQEVGDPFYQMIYGHPKNGKTSYTLQLVHELCKIGRVLYNSYEEGDSITLQQAMKRAKLDEVEPKQLLIGDRLNYRQMMERLRKSSAKFVVIDSRDYMGLTFKQWTKLTTTFKKKELHPNLLGASWQACREVR